MGQMLYAVATKRPGGFEFRVPSSEDLEAVHQAEADWRRRSRVGSPRISFRPKHSPKETTTVPLTYGMPTWADFFSPRQLLAYGIFMENVAEISLRRHETAGH